MQRDVELALAAGHRVEAGEGGARRPRLEARADQVAERAALGARPVAELQ
jgi:hypothetical protein